MFSGVLVSVLANDATDASVKTAALTSLVALTTFSGNESVLLEKLAVPVLCRTIQQNSVTALRATADAIEVLWNLLEDATFDAAAQQASIIKDFVTVSTH